MSGKLKSQWDFSGELFPAAEMRRVLSVTEVTATIRRLLEERVGTVWVTGEVSNLRTQTSGHVYFSLKDGNAQLACVCFRDEARSTRHLLKDGQKVVLHGEVTVYEVRGQYQLLVHAVELAGIGALQAAFERLKQKLNAEGLFAPERKRPLPAFIQRIGIVTSQTGAALHDVLHVIERRQPSLDLVLVACRVQGQGAHDEIASAIRLLNDWAARGNALDVILVTRGGGSLEDLWSFNEEVVARAIFHSAVPVVSAIGHEIDFTISDFVADLRAATPSAAAELITEGMFRRRQWVAESARRIAELTRVRIRSERENAAWLTDRLTRAHPRRKLREQWQRVDELGVSLFRCSKRGIQANARELLAMRQRLAWMRPSRLLALRRELLADFAARLPQQARHALAAQQQRWLMATARLRLLAPAHVLERGFSITRDATTGNIIRDAHTVQPGQRLTIDVQTGRIRTAVEQ